MKKLILIVALLASSSCATKAKHITKLNTYSCPESLSGRSGTEWLLTTETPPSPWIGPDILHHKADLTEVIKLKQAKLAVYPEWQIGCIYQSGITRTILGIKISSGSCKILNEDGPGPHFECDPNSRPEHEIRKSHRNLEDLKSDSTFLDETQDLMTSKTSEPVDLIGETRTGPFTTNANSKIVLTNYTCPDSMKGYKRKVWHRLPDDELPSPWTDLGGELLSPRNLDIINFSRAKFGVHEHRALGCIYDSLDIRIFIGVNAPVEKCKILKENGRGPHFECKLTEAEIKSTLELNQLDIIGIFDLID
jgi:hypothetical protein